MIEIVCPPNLSVWWHKLLAFLFVLRLQLKITLPYIFTIPKLSIRTNEDDESFCRKVEWRKGFSLISSRSHCQRSSPFRISDTPRTGFEPVQNPSSGFVEWGCAVVITITPRRHKCVWVTKIWLYKPFTGCQRNRLNRKCQNTSYFRRFFRGCRNGTPKIKLVNVTILPVIST